jgi:hypothetical protein
MRGQSVTGRNLAVVVLNRFSKQDIKWGSLVRRMRAPEEHRSAPSARVCNQLLEVIDMARESPPDQR